MRRLLPFLAAMACGRGQSLPSPGGLDSAGAITSYAAGLPADSFPVPARPTSAIVAPRWTAELQRDVAREAETVMDAMRIAPGAIVADIGAGDGYYVVRLADRVGRAGRVFGQDIVPDYLDLLRDRVARARLRNVVVVAGEPHDPRLPGDSIDAAILIHMYHEISDPYALLWNLAGALRPEGRVGILDTTSPTNQHGTPLATLHCELGHVGYVKERVVEIAEGEYLAIYRAPARGARPAPAAVRSAAARGCPA